MDRTTNKRHYTSEPESEKSGDDSKHGKAPGLKLVLKLGGTTNEVQINERKRKHKKEKKKKKKKHRDQEKDEKEKVNIESKTTIESSIKKELTICIKRKDTCVGDDDATSNIPISEETNIKKEIDNDLHSSITPVIDNTSPERSISESNIPSNIDISTPRKSDDDIKTFNIPSNKSSPEKKINPKNITSDTVNTNTPSNSRPQREKKDNRRANLKSALDYIHRLLSRKDVKNRFSSPVTDSIAPGYSLIIKYPMDLSTMSEKIAADQYETIFDYKSDFKAMCENATIYNQPGTIYYRDAKRLWQAAEKLFSSEKLLNMRKDLPCMMALSLEELGLTEDLEIKTAPSPLATTTYDFNLLTPTSNEVKEEYQIDYKANLQENELEPEDILKQAETAAAEVADKLRANQPESKIGYLKRKEDGSAAFVFLNGNQKESNVTLGQLVGKIREGTSQIIQITDDLQSTSKPVLWKNVIGKQNPVKFLNYGPFSTYGPIYNSTFANLDLNDSKTLLNVYGDENSAVYANSLRSFVNDCGDIAIEMVDAMLDYITGSKHKNLWKKAEAMQNEENRIKKEIDEKKNTNEHLCSEMNSNQKLVDEIDFNSLRGLSNELNIDMNFLETFENEAKIQKKLDETSTQLQDLESEQLERISRKLPKDGKILTTSDDEQVIARAIRTNLSELVRILQPGPVSEPIRHSIAQPITSTIEANATGSIINNYNMLNNRENNSKIVDGIKVVE